MKQRVWRKEEVKIMVGFEWWTGSWGQWLFVAMTVIPVIAAVAMEVIVRVGRIRDAHQFRKRS